MGKTREERPALERIEIDERRLRALVQAVSEALRPPEGTVLFDGFQEIGSPAQRSRQKQEGLYLFRAEDARVSSEAAAALFENLLRCFRERIPEQSGSWDAIESGLSGGPEATSTFLQRVLGNDARHLFESAAAWGVTPETLSFFCLFWARPFRAEAARRLLEEMDLSGWRMGFCPVCGHWPAFGYLPAEGGRRTLWCAACTTRWTFERIRCPFCLNTDSKKLPYFTVDDNESLPIYVCEECKRYLKHRREEKGESREEDTDFVLTAPLDYVAVNEGYIQESLISVRFDEPGGESGRAYRAKAHYREGPEGPDRVH